MKLVPVQVLRAAAALSVAMLHAQHEAAQHAAATGRSFAPPAGFPWQAGVDVFFVISGFVMVYASRGLFGRAGARRVFLARRVARIVPIYWLATTLYLAVALAAPALVNSALLAPAFVAASYLFIPAARPDGLVQPLYSLGWTLNYEMVFYGLFALALGFARVRAVGLVAAALVGLAVLGQLATWPQPLAFWTDPIILEFALGMTLGFARAEGIRIGMVSRAALALAGLAGLAAAETEASGLLRPLQYGVPAACLVAACGLGHDDPWSEDGALARFGAALGDASYALYLIHPFVLRAVGQGARRAGWEVDPWFLLCLGLILTLAASLLVYRFVERPLTRLVRARLEPRAPA